MRKLLASLALLLLLAVPAHAGSNPYDGLTLLGSGGVFPDGDGDTLEVLAFRTKYGEKVVGFYFTSGATQVRFYANATTWDGLKQLFIKARDRWDTLSPASFVMLGSVKSYQIANRLSTMVVSLQGATALDTKQLLLSATGGAAQPKRVMVDLGKSDLQAFVEELYRVDALLHGASPPGS